MQSEDEIYSGGEGLVWHPAIKAIGWLKDWTIWAVFAAVIWQWIDGSLRHASFGSVLSRTAAICSVLAACIVPLKVVHEWVRMCREARRRYCSDTVYLRSTIGVVSTIFLFLLGLYGLAMWWVFRWVWPRIWKLAPVLGSADPIEFPNFVPLWAAILIVVVAGYVTFRLVRPLPAKHFRVWQILGRRTLRGYLVMAILRLRQPRKDFFFQAPLIRDVPMLAIAAVVHTFARPQLLAFALPLFLITASLSMTLDHLLPPAWLFLGRSHSDSYLTFDTLRMHWHEFGVTFLSRDSEQWSAHYFASSDFFARHGWPFARLFITNPGTPRVWSLRSRGDMWESSVTLLMKLVQVIFVDARVKSYWIFDEVLWLAELGWMEKAWLLGTPEGRAPALEEALSWAKEDNVVLPPKSAERLAERIVTEKQLRESRWADDGFEIAR
jgi:hypothetical protein